MEGGGFLKQMQNKLKNIKRKLEKIQAKEKRPASELSEEEKELMRNRPNIEMFNQEYERLIANYLSSREAGGVTEPQKPEVRVEVKEEDNTEEILKVWVALHYASLPAAQELYLAQGLPKDDLTEVLALRTEILGKPGDSLLALHSAALPLLAKYVQKEAKPAEDGVTRMIQWALQQKVPSPPPVPVLQVHSLPQQDIVHAPEPEPTPVQPPQEAAPELPVLPKDEPVEAVPEAPKEESKEHPTGNWAEQGDEEEEVPPAAQPKDKEPEEDDGFVTVGKTKRSKPPQTEARGAYQPRRRGGFRGDRRGRGWRGGDRGGQQ